MKYKDYSPEIWKQIHQTLEQVLKTDKAPVAAFDADGTLWDLDLGENFFQFQIDRGLVSLPENPWDYYHDLKSQDPRKAYLWLAQICQGQPLETIQAWAKEALRTQEPLPLFEPQQKLIELLTSHNVTVFIVTASIKWAVEPGSAFFNLSPDQVIGVETQVEHGKITTQQKGVISYKEGKPEALKARTGGKSPFLVSGNTMGDFELLLSATHLRLAVSASSRDDRLFKTERELAEWASREGWLQHRFV